MFSYIYFILNIYLWHILATGEEGIGNRKALAVVVWGFLFIKLAFTIGEILKASLFLLYQNLPHGREPEGMKPRRNETFILSKLDLFQMDSLRNSQETGTFWTTWKDHLKDNPKLWFSPGIDTDNSTNIAVPKREGVWSSCYYCSKTQSWELGFGVWLKPGLKEALTLTHQSTSTALCVRAVQSKFQFRIVERKRHH